MLRRKQRHYPAEVTFVGVSEWVSSAARASSVLRDRDIRTIHNCIDVGRFRPMDKTAARQALGLPRDLPILLHGAINLDDAYKGGSLLEAAKEHLRDDHLFICTFGASRRPGAIRHDRAFGYVGDDEQLRRLYCAADVVVSPSIEEAFGKVAAEALACGTPVVAFAAASFPEMVRHRRTGFLATPYEPEDLARGVRWLLGDPARLARIGSDAAADAHARFSPEVAAASYLALYREKPNACALRI